VSGIGRLDGKVALVTGAARGQGRSHALALAQEGADVVAVDICRPVETVSYPMATEGDLAETVAAVERLDRRIVAAPVDVRDLEGFTAFVDDAVGRLGRLDVVSANAGIAGLASSTIDLSSDEWAEMIGVNLTGVWHTAKVAVPHIVRGGRGGSVVLTSSVAGLKAYPGIGHYVAAKHGVIGLMKALALELAPHDIRVNAISPTNVDTPMIQNEALWRRFVPDKEAPTAEDYAERAKQLNVLPHPWVEPSDISEALVFLASDAARYITGVTLPVDLGSMLH
jgi:SDR family mycofactocin-dependent oxidoreductase